jgi:ribosome-associated toxin RatA of RatAB toxin-antitoxin module
MTTVERSALVLHTDEQMFNLINDVERYPEFLPWCSSVNLQKRSEDDLTATLFLSKGGFKYHFTTHNQLNFPKEMTISLVDGPFSHLSGTWTFTALSEEACKVNLVLEFGFSGKLTALAMGKVFNQVANTMVDAFVKRADAIYGG